MLNVHVVHLVVDLLAHLPQQLLLERPLLLEQCLVLGDKHLQRFTRTLLRLNLRVHLLLQLAYLVSVIFHDFDLLS